MSFYGYPQYISAAERQQKAEKRLKKLIKQGKVLNPVQSSGRKLVTSNLAKLWCDHVEQEIAYCSQRLSRGRTYLRHGLVLHLEINKGEIKAIVSGTNVYQIAIKVEPLAAPKWQMLQQLCLKNSESVCQLFDGEFSEQLANIFADSEHGIFPQLKEIKYDCECYDFYGEACKHISAVLYAVGVMLDNDMQKLFLLRGVNYEELFTAYTDKIKQSVNGYKASNSIDDSHLKDLFGVELQTTS